MIGSTLKGASLIELDPKLAQALAPHMERALVVDPLPASARLMTDLLHNIWPGQVWAAATTRQALSLAQSVEPQLIFTEYAGEELDGLAFTRGLRRSDFACRKAPVIMLTAHATPAAILGARDAGVHEFLRKPFTNKDLIRRIEVVVCYPRGWVEAVGYVGPDRRRFNSAEYKGARKRPADSIADPLEARLVQALQIVSAAVAATLADPSQSLRSLNAQAMELKRLGTELRRPDLMSAACELQDSLVEAARGKPLTREDVLPAAEKLLAFMPSDIEVEPRSAA